MIAPFELERYFGPREFAARFNLSVSDAEALTLAELLPRMTDETRGLWETLSLGYTHSPGHPRLRAEIASLYEDVVADDVLVAAPEEGIFIAMHAMLRPGDHVICTAPGYQSLYEVARSIGCEVDLWTPEEGDRWHFDLEALQNLARPNTALLVINFPHNPTGALPSRAEFKALLDWAHGAGIRVFSDEMYRLLELDESARLPSAVDAGDRRAVALFGMSKTFSLAGLRIGWVVTKDRQLRARMEQMKDYTTICSSAPSEILAIAGLEIRDELVATNRQRIRDNLDALTKFCDAHPSLARFVPPEGGTICFPRLLGERSASALASKAFEERGILLLPSTVYDYGDAHIRIGLGRAPFQEGLDALGELLTAR